MGWYAPSQPIGEHAGVLACSWTARPTGRHRLVPDACVDLVCTFEAAGAGRERVTMLLCGPERRAWTFRLPEGVTAVGVRYRPGCAAIVHGLDAAAMVDRRLPFADVVGRAAADELADRLRSSDSLDVRRLELERALSPVLRDVPQEQLAFVDLVTDRLVATRRIGRQALADEVGLTPRHLHRRLLRTFGYGTSVLGRLLRFQRFLSVRETTGAGSLAELAAAAGYADQAHLARDCRAITGLTVRQLLAEWFPTFPDMSDPFKTAEPLAATMAK